MSPTYSSPPDTGAFKALVWKIVQQIPPGKVCSYGRVASFIPPPPGMDPPDYQAFGARWVGGAMANSPEGVPWQRVVNAQGKISLKPGRGYEQQRQLLIEEGIEFDQRGRIDLERFGWEGPGEEWLRNESLL
jgi:methylated-DNA-protein-cysteine methyltransferase related protein